MSFTFDAAGTIENVVGQLIESDDRGDALGKALRSFLIEHLASPPPIGPGWRYFYVVHAAGASGDGVMPSLYVETEVVWVPYVHAGTAEQARELCEKRGAAPGRGTDGPARTSPEAH